MSIRRNSILCIIILIVTAGLIGLNQLFHTKPTNASKETSAKHDNWKKIPLHPLGNRSDFNIHLREPRKNHPLNHPNNDSAARLKEFQKMASSRTFATLDKDNNLSEDAIKNAKLSDGEAVILNQIFGDFHGDMLNLIRSHYTEGETTEENGIKYYNYEISPYLSYSVDRIAKLVSSVESTIGKDRGAIVLSGYPLGMNYLGSGQYRVTFSLYTGDADFDGWRCKYTYTDPINETIGSEGTYNFDSPNNNALSEVFEIK